MLKRVRFCGPRRTQFRMLLVLNRSTRLSAIKTGRVGAIGMDGRAPKIEGESEERVFHSAKGFMLVEVSMRVFLGFGMRENGKKLRLRMESSSERVVA